MRRPPRRLERREQIGHGDEARDPLRAGDEPGTVPVDFQPVTHVRIAQFGLAAEALLGSPQDLEWAIAQGQVPARHWFRLARPLTWAGGSLVVLSWGGTMFEYLMPSLLMHDYDNSLLEQTSRSVVREQRHYGAARRVPWGVSESAFNVRDRAFTYQYSAFGVPGLGATSIKRIEELVATGRGAAQQLRQRAAAVEETTADWKKKIDLKTSITELFASTVLVFAEQESNDADQADESPAGEDGAPF